MRFRAICVLALSAVLALGGSAQAELLDQGLKPPILVTFDLKVTYDADGGTGGNGLLTALGSFDPWGNWTSLQDYSPDGVTSTGTYLGYFYLEAEIDKTTLEFVGGMVSCSSDQDWDGYLDADLDWSGGNLGAGEFGERVYSTDLVAFGFGGYGLFDFLFANSSGDLVQARDNGYVYILIDGIFDGSGAYSLPTDWDTFQYDFENNTTGKADVPEPATLGLLTAAGVSLLARRRRR